MDIETKQTEKIQRIIALKRYEQPPPGYFHLLPNRIINRIEKGEGKAGVWETWFSTFTPRPAWACAFGLGVCSVATLGIFYPRQSGMEAISNSQGLATAFYTASASAPATPVETGGSLRPASWMGGSTDPITTQQASLFDSHESSQEALTVPVSLSLGN